MKLVKQTKIGFQYRLIPEEAYSLRFIVQQFPVTEFSAAKISKTDLASVEREKLLNEALAAHREELKLRARNLIRSDRFRPSGKDQLYHLSPEGRESMLQILNDVRVECWRMLGEPDNPDLNVFDLPPEKVKHCHLMHLAGYFEHHFLDLEKP